jgi:hypothetical protein
MESVPTARMDFGATFVPSRVVKVVCIQRVEGEIANIGETDVTKHAIKIVQVEVKSMGCALLANLDCVDHFVKTNVIGRVALLAAILGPASV